jgi:hypothetical protein
MFLYEGVDKVFWVVLQIIWRRLLHLSVYFEYIQELCVKHQTYNFYTYTFCEMVSVSSSGGDVTYPCLWKIIYVLKFIF